MKNSILLFLALLGLFAAAGAVQGQQGMGPQAQAGIHEPGTALYEDEDIVILTGELASNLTVTEVDDMAEEHIAKADAFLKMLPENNLLLMDMQELIDAVDAGDESMVIVDVRPASLYDAGHIEGSINVPFPELVPKMDMVPTDKKIAVVCTFDTNSAFAVSVMRIFGDRDAWVVVGGVPGWVDAGRELVATEM